MVDFPQREILCRTRVATSGTREWEGFFTQIRVGWSNSGDSEGVAGGQADLGQGQGSPLPT